MKNRPSVTMIVPIHNSSSTLEPVFKSIEKQDYPISEVWLLDNNSNDNSYEMMQNYAKKSRFKIKVIRHTKDQGLSYSYNEAISAAKTDCVVTLQSDCVIRDKNGVSRLIKPFVEDESMIATCARQITPWNVWEKYGFWQKAYFSRHVGRVASGRNGRFCCFLTKALKDAGLFDVKTFRTAGEDGDMFFKLEQMGKVIDVETIADHLHDTSNNFKLKNYIYKENQLAEGGGACFGKNFGKISARKYLTPLLRPVLLLGLLIPKANIVFAALIFIYSFWFTKEVIIHEWKNPRILILPFINIYLLFSFTFFFFKGFITKRQQL